MRLYLLRHAQAEVADERGADADRPLSPGGRRDAASVGAWLARRPEPPTYILCSSARRTVETMEGVVSALGTRPTTQVSEELYQASAWKLFELARAIPDRTQSLLVVAHNPGVAELALRLSAAGDLAARHQIARQFRPATLAELELPAARWAELDPETGVLMDCFAV